MKDAPPRTIRAQIGPFAMVPVWVLDRCHDSRAIHLYALLGKYTNRDRRAWPKLETLADEMSVVPRTVERAIATLRAAGALETERRHRADGAVLGLDFLLIVLPPTLFDLPDTDVGMDAADLPDTGVGKAGVLKSGLPDTSVEAFPTPVSVISISEPDPLEPDLKAACRGPVPPGPENPDDNLGVIAVLAHEVLDLYAGDPIVTLGELAESVKQRCGLYHIAYNTAVVARALESALFQRRLAGKPSVLAGSAGEAAFRLKGAR